MPILNPEILQNLVNKSANARILAISEAADEAAKEIDTRIFDKAQNLNKTSPRTPDYSDDYARQRTNQGLQIAIVDYEFTGELRKSVDLTLNSNGSATLEINGRRAKVSYYLETMRGKAFGPDQREKDLIKVVLFRKLTEILTK